MKGKNPNFTKTDREDSIAQLTAEKMLFDPNAKLEIKEILEKFCLITYDLPATPEGAKARADFLNRAKFHGALMHTESVYIAPWSIANDLNVLRTAGVGKVRIFVSVPLEKEECAEITRDYDKKLSEVFKEAEDRFEKIIKHVEEEQLGLAHKMLPKSEEQVTAMKKAAIARGSQHLFDRWEDLDKKIRALRALLPATVGAGV